MLRTGTAHGVATLLLDRADRGNALSAPLVEALLEALDASFADPAIHTVAFAGAGRHFCTGFDLDGLESASDSDLLWRFVRIETLLARVWHAPVRTVAIACGRTWGAGADLFAACDLRLADAGATFRFPGAGFGLVLGTRRLAERVGSERARHWVTQGTSIDSGEALADGLVSRFVPTGSDDAAPDGAALLAATLAAQFSEPPAVDHDTLATLLRASREDHRDADLAALVRSAARPGLAARITHYRDRMRTAAHRE